MFREKRISQKSLLSIEWRPSDGVYRMVSIEWRSSDAQKKARRCEEKKWQLDCVERENAKVWRVKIEILFLSSTQMKKQRFGHEEFRWPFEVRQPERRQCSGSDLSQTLFILPA